MFSWPTKFLVVQIKHCESTEPRESPNSQNVFLRRAVQNCAALSRWFCTNSILHWAVHYPHLRSVIRHSKSVNPELWLHFWCHFLHLCIAHKAPSNETWSLLKIAELEIWSVCMESAWTRYLDQWFFNPYCIHLLRKLIFEIRDVSHMTKCSRFSHCTLLSDTQVTTWSLLNDILVTQNEHRYWHAWYCRSEVSEPVSSMSLLGWWACWF